MRTTVDEVSGEVRVQEAAVRAKAEEVIDFLQIGHVADEYAGNLSGGQKKLLDAKVLILGAGGLGAPVIAGLAGAGVGHLTVIDDD